MQNGCLQLNEYSKAGAKPFPPDFRMGQKLHSGEALMSGVFKTKNTGSFRFLNLPICKFTVHILSERTKQIHQS
jgi:hypothetical protein